MGEVYRARDIKLGRDVALKVLPALFASDPERLARFRREAQLLAALNHPNIAGIYGLEDSTSTLALVLELVEGETLAERMERGRIPVDDALRIARQIADALGAAHECGIVHRDLKPANILVGPHGVKVLDFGIAKIMDGASGPDFSAAATSTALTTEGTRLGTVAYMAPEQIEGKAADARSDLFAFGIVLYELLAGRRPFSGTSEASLVASILKDDPRPLYELQPLTRPAIARVVQACLEKDPAKRWQSARDIQLALEWTFGDAPVPETKKSVRLWQGVAAVAAMSALVAVVLAGRVLWPKAAESVNRFDASLPEGVTSFDWVSVSPDGRKLVFNEAAQGSLWIRDFDSVTWKRLPDTDGAASPVWSPDSRSLAFGAGNQLKKIDLAGGPPVTVATLPSLVYGSGTWNRNGVIILGSWGGGSSGPLWKISQTGSAPAPITQVDATRGELYHTWPVFLEDGVHFLYFRSGPPDVEGIYVGSLEVPAQDQSRQRILASHYSASYANGYLFFPRQFTLLAQPFDARRLQLKDAPAVPVVDAIDLTWYATGVFSVSPSGAVVYRAPSASGPTQLTWIDRRGKIVGTIGPPGSFSNPAVSPDGTRAVVNVGPPGQSDLWVFDLSSGQPTRLTFGRDVDSPGLWSKDGTRIAYSAGTHADTLYDKASSGVGEARELLREPGQRLWPSDWSRDGRFLLFWTWDAPKTGADVWVLPLQGNRKPVLLLGEPFNEWGGVFSPDMHWIAYSVFLQSGRVELWLRPFRVSESGVPSLGEGRWQITKDGGNFARWTSDKELIFNEVPWGDGEYAVSVTTNGDVPEFGAPERLFTGTGLGSASWNIAPDGQRFLLAQPQVKRTAQAPLTVVLNWPALVKKQVHGRGRRRADRWDLALPP
jgi:serine/threonine protein kinase